MERLTAVRMVLLLVFVGWLFMWVMLPTKTYKDSWKLTLSARLGSTYFREQGTNLLLFSFPIMFLASLGCVYLHFQKKSCPESNLSRRSWLDSWNRPLIVMNPLGIVSAMELMFAAMFVVLLGWSLGNYLYVSFGHLHMHTASEKLVGLTSESSVKYHIWLGHLSMVLFTAHSVGFIIYWAITDQMALMLEWSRTYVSNVAGEIAFILALVMWVTSIPRVRRKMFELFFYAHQTYILYLFFYIIHVGVAYFCLILPGIFLFLIDRYLRFLQSRTNVRVVAARLLPCDTLELNFTKIAGLDYNPASILFLNVPSISKLQWHPFTVTSNANMEPDMLTVLIKARQEQQPDDEHHKLPKSVVLICAFKNSADLSMLDILLPLTSNLTSRSYLSEINLEIQAYITRETEQPLENTKKPLQTIWFKPHPSDSPISAPLGPNSWLWLCAIISSSFVMFLVLLGILTRYHIYPKERVPEGSVYNYTFKTLWDMFLVCGSVFLATSFVFLWQKKENNKKEGMKVQNLEGDHEVGEEIESVAHRSVLETTEVHFSRRPDLKSILMEKNKKGSATGVLVSGPRNMRHEVAKICSSPNQAKNLHLEAMSFNW
ncbi:hypothetical protein Ccrd_011445 [Cynara cardunculus var. scolymus]|uniref:Uncharacterized protein n=1 Tax=Cynara cardunculus var. scolymus TaxID=59895 RepID=A0A103YJD9_CYNCS|nr:hypothetical protein Ccrd_011445 [Cynara cardunculus var. scolymus]